LCLSLWSCGAFDEEPPVYVEQPVEVLYNDAMNAMQAGNLGEAARLFDEV
jgi:outer membrane protein assembly factor BamD (BamD/ComL family)